MNKDDGQPLLLLIRVFETIHLVKSELAHGTRFFIGSDRQKKLEILLRVPIPPTQILFVGNVVTN